MKTDSLIELLARGAGPAPAPRVPLRLGAAAAGGLLASLVLALASLGPVPAALFATPAPWMKMAYAGALALAAAALAMRLARPLARLAGPLRALLGVAAAMALIGLAAGVSPPTGDRLGAWLGHSWAQCPFIVLGLSLPALAVGLWALRDGAPTHPAWAGGAVGLFAGALGAFGYAFACTETSPAFVAAWYSAGIALAGLLGAALGPRVLRW